MAEKILLVEDEALIALSETRMIEKHGFEVLSASNGERAIEVIASDPEISLVLMDIDLGPGMDGTETVRRILQQRQLPIIFLTSHSEKEYVDRVEEISGYGYVLKNSGEFVLMESIRMAFKLFTAYRSMQESEEKYRAAFMTSPDSVNINRLDGLYVDINEGFTALTGFTREETIGKKSSEIEIWAIPEDRMTLVKGLEEDGVVENLESVFRCKDGTLKTALMSARLITIKDQPHILSITRDISEQKETEEEARKAKRFLDNISDLAYEADTMGRVTYVNPAAERLTGISVDELIGSSFQPLFREEDQPSLMEVYRRTLEGEVLENTLTFTNGVTCHFTTLPRYDADGTIMGTFGIARDITFRKEEERRLRDSIQEKELLMRELNHRVKNNLLMVTSLVRLKHNSLGEDVDLSDLEHRITAIRIIHESLNQGNNIDSINMRAYLAKVLDTVFSFVPLQVEIENRIEDVALDSRTAVPVGLIVNELATNAVKHGFKSDLPAVFRIGLNKVQNPARYVLTIGNTGAAFPEKIELNHSQTLGLQLITSLVNQLCGTLNLDRSPEPLFTISFPA